jgi:hypothetical protein
VRRRGGEATEQENADLMQTVYERITVPHPRSSATG